MSYAVELGSEAAADGAVAELSSLSTTDFDALLAAAASDAGAPSMFATVSTTSLATPEASLVSTSGAEGLAGVAAGALLLAAAVAL